MRSTYLPGEFPHVPALGVKCARLVGGPSRKRLNEAGSRLPVRCRCIVLYCGRDISVPSSPYFRTQGLDREELMLEGVDKKMGHGVERLPASQIGIEPSYGLCARSIRAYTRSIRALWSPGKPSQP